MYLCTEPCEDAVRIHAKDLDELIDRQNLLESDLVTLVDHIDQLLECFEDMIHLNQSMAGIVANAEDRLDLHRRRTVRGMMKKLKKKEREAADLCDSAEDALEDMSVRWDFLTMAADAGDDPFDF